MTTNNAVNMNNVSGYISDEELKDELVNLLMACAILPVSKVEGKDLWGRETGRGGLKELYKERQEVAKARFEGDREGFMHFMQLVAGEFTDKLQKYNDEQDELYKNEDVDDLAARFEKIELEQFDYEFQEYKRAKAYVEAIADEAQKRHNRMATRMAIVSKVKKVEDEDERNKLLSQVNDELAERVLDKEHKFDSNLQPFAVTRREILAQEREILVKNQAAYSKHVLEQKAKLLRSITMRAEEMMLAPGFKPCFMRINGKQVRTDFVGQAIDMCNQMKTWCEQQLAREREYKLATRKPIKDASRYTRKVILQEKTPVTCFRRYSVTSLMALYNEAVSGLNALGVFKAYFPKTAKGYEPSFFFNPTRQGMVEVKTGSDWSDDLRVLFYETEDGTGRTPVRNSGVDG